MKQTIQNTSNGHPQQVQSGKSSVSQLSPFKMISKSCRSLLIDLPLSTLTRVRSINGSSRLETLKSRGMETDEWLSVEVATKGEKVGFQILEEKTASGKLQVLIAEIEDGYFCRSDLKKYAKEIVQKCFGRDLVTCFTWYLGCTNGTIISIDKEVR